MLLISWEIAHSNPSQIAAACCKRPHFAHLRVCYCAIATCGACARLRKQRMLSITCAVDASAPHSISDTSMVCRVWMWCPPVMCHTCHRKSLGVCKSLLVSKWSMGLALLSLASALTSLTGAAPHSCTRECTVHRSSLDQTCGAVPGPSAGLLQACTDCRLARSAGLLRLRGCVAGDTMY